jgi:hypothetical protein
LAAVRNGPSGGTITGTKRQMRIAIEARPLIYLYHSEGKARAAGLTGSGLCEPGWGGANLVRLRCSPPARPRLGLWILPVASAGVQQLCEKRAVPVRCSLPDVRGRRDDRCGIGCRSGVQLDRSAVIARPASANGKTLATRDLSRPASHHPSNSGRLRLITHGRARPARRRRRR